MNLKKLVLLLVPLMFISCLSTKPWKLPQVTPNDSVLKHLLEWPELENDIFSWLGQSKSTLVRSWGLPTNSMNIGEDEDYFEYSIENHYQTTVGKESAESYYNEYSDKTYSTKTLTATTTTNTTYGIVRLTLVNNKIEHVSYEGYYSELRKICKSRGDNNTYSPTLLYNKIQSRVHHTPTFEDFKTSELFEFLIPLSGNNIEVSKYFFKTYLDTTLKDTYNDDETQAYRTLVILYNGLKSSKNIELFLAELVAYREIFKNEQFNWEPFFISEDTDRVLEYTLDDINLKRVNWNEIPLEDIQALTVYSFPSIIDSWEKYNTIEKVRDEWNKIEQKIGEKELEKAFVNDINLQIDQGLTSASIYMWIITVECYYERFPNKIPK